MADTTELPAQSALTHLTGELKASQAERNALAQTVNELLTNNIALRTQASLMQEENAGLRNDLNDYIKRENDLQKQVAIYSETIKQHSERLRDANDVPTNDEDHDVPTGDANDCI